VRAPPRVAEPAGAPPEGSAPALASSESLAEQFSRIAHAHEGRPIDVVLRSLDLAIAGLCLMVLSPIVVLVSLGILVASGRPILYRGERVGRAGRVFTMYKLRTLTPDAEARLGPYLELELTRRTETEVTAIGRALRATHLDEIPQLWNVLRGDMSMVGPRPIRPPFFAELCEHIPQYWQRLVIRPGVTGFAQTRMTREESWVDKLAHDMEYIADRSVRLYLRILAATASRVVGRMVGGNHQPAGH
jgi:lipopolysaccharide/colanic/teichoic acid biosynthesis glycosyltransferase